MKIIHSANLKQRNAIRYVTKAVFMYLYSKQNRN